jgi:ketosteroid isomerase-like protein
VGRELSGAAPSSEDVIANYLDALVRKDGSAVNRYFDPDVEYVVNGSPLPDPAAGLPPISTECLAALPWLGLHRGRRAVETFLAHMHRNLEVVAFGPREVISDGDRAAAFGWFRLHSVTTGATRDIAYSIRFEIRDGLITRYHFLENTFDVAMTFRVDGSWLLNVDSQERRVPSGLEG